MFEAAADGRLQLQSYTPSVVAGMVHRRAIEQSRGVEVDRRRVERQLDSDATEYSRDTTWRYESYSVRRAPNAHIGMRGKGTTESESGRRWHGRECPTCRQWLDSRASVCPDCGPVKSEPAGSQQGPQALFRGNPLPPTVSELGRAGAPQVACKRGMVFLPQVPRKLRRKLVRLVGLAVAGKATNPMLLELVESIRKLQTYVACGGTR